ncbi:MAG: DUF305 domain-containing protein, partial [Acidimicrobiia bacterium]|nr:DUF305 domain-containing protein [Acidimicrobiia bacterium]
MCCPGWWGRPGTAPPPLHRWPNGCGSGAPGSAIVRAAPPAAIREVEDRRLEGADGDAFDALWLQMMTAHHEGAIEMAAEVQG